MGLVIDYIEGQTPIDEDEKEGLLIKSISTREELDEFEQYNIEKAIEWTLGKRWNSNYIISENFVKELHYKMFSEVWAWAGEFRKTNKNIGVDKHQIGISLRQLIDDANYWLANKTYTDDETAMHFKHRIVKIHCFPNGNGRHSRLIADVIISHIFGKPVFTWSRTNLTNKGEARTKYINAIKTADNGNIELLVSFART
jgi:Fic-DOC domain mobile mystery protein B